MANYNLKAKRKSDGEIFKYHKGYYDNDKLYWICDEVTSVITQQEFNELYEVMSDTCQEHVNTLPVEDTPVVKKNLITETWRDRLRSHEFAKFDDETFEEQINYEEIENFFQQELERICEEGEKLKREDSKHELKFNMAEVERNENYNQAIDDIINIIKK